LNGLKAGKLGGCEAGKPGCWEAGKQKGNTHGSAAFGIVALADRPDGFDANKLVV